MRGPGIDPQDTAKRSARAAQTAAPRRSCNGVEVGDVQFFQPEVSEEGGGNVARVAGRSKLADDGPIVRSASGDAVDNMALFRSRTGRMRAGSRPSMLQERGCPAVRARRLAAAQLTVSGS